MSWEAVFDAATFPRATLLSRSAPVGYLHPLPSDSAFEDDASLPVSLDASPATLTEANAITLAWGYHLAHLLHHIHSLLADIPTLTPPSWDEPPPAPPGMLRQSICLNRPASTPAWSPLLGAAHINTPREGVYDFAFPFATPWARVAIGLSGEVVVMMVPREMPLGAAAWAQVVRLALEVILPDPREDDEGKERGEGKEEWEIASVLTPPMNKPMRITEPRGAEARILPQDFEDDGGEGKKGYTLFDRFRHAF